MAAVLLGEILLKKRLISRSQLQDALAEQEQASDLLGNILLRKKFIKEEDLFKTLSEQYNIPYLPLKNRPIDWSTAMRFSRHLIEDHRCLPIGREESGVVVAIVDPLDALTISEMEREAKNEKIHWDLVSHTDMDQAIHNFDQWTIKKAKRLLDTKEDQPLSS